MSRKTVVTGGVIATILFVTLFMYVVFTDPGQTGPSDYIEYTPAPTRTSR
jgi:hypothetical protein